MADGLNVDGLIVVVVLLVLMLTGRPRRPEAVEVAIEVMASVVGHVVDVVGWVLAAEIK